MKNPFSIKRDIAMSQSKGCWLFIQFGCSALVMRQMWGKPRDVAIVHAQIDTPYQRFTLTVHGIGKKNPRGKRSVRFALPAPHPNGGYRDRWLRKLGYSVS